MKMCKIEIGKDLKELNNEIAAKNRNSFKLHDIFVLNIMGSPGAGKTTLLENILPLLSEKYHIVVIEGDLATENDAQRIRKTGVTALQINTNGGCHLDAHMIHHEFEKINAAETELIIIENVGNLVCPISFDLGEDLRIVVLSTPEGEDKPLKYPPAMLKTDAVILTKTDLAGYVDVNTEIMKKHITDINPRVCVMESGKINGVYSADKIVSYIKDKIEAKKVF
ncbi:MAG: hydrogenase nickel incorporation protein HypB [Bacillota bacterium]|nr:hydrogenase nickel incorporation protein HypB [Bacillota bacterium]